MKITIVIPAYNEEKRIGNTLERYLKFINEHKKNNNYEILVVINNTKDKTEEVVKSFIKKDENIISYLNYKQGGKGFAIIEGFKEALKRKSDLIGFVDADLATGPKEFIDLVDNINNFDGIIASRRVKGAKIIGKTLKRKLFSAGFNLLVRGLFFLPFKDTQCGAKVFRNNVIRKIILDLKITNWAFDVNLLYLCKKNKFKIREFPTVWEDKEDSKINSFKTPLQMFLGIVKLRCSNSFLKPMLRSIEPLLYRIYNSLEKQLK